MNTSAATGVATMLTCLLYPPSGEIYFSPPPQKKWIAATKLDQKWRRVPVFGCILLCVALVSFRGQVQHPLQCYQPS